MAFLAGVAYNEDGHTRAGMGVDFGDYDGDGRLDLIVTNFTSEGNAPFRNGGDGSFAEVTRHTGIRKNSFLKVGFGVRFFDYDNDTDLDVLAVNGHVIPRIGKGLSGSNRYTLLGSPGTLARRERRAYPLRYVRSE